LAVAFSCFPAHPLLSQAYAERASAYFDLGDNVMASYDYEEGMGRSGEATRAAVQPQADVHTAMSLVGTFPV
jgi:hypothetical protein